MQGKGFQEVIRIQIVPTEWSMDCASISFSKLQQLPEMGIIM